MQWQKGSKQWQSPLKLLVVQKHKQTMKRKLSAAFQLAPLIKKDSCIAACCIVACSIAAWWAACCLFQFLREHRKEQEKQASILAAYASCARVVIYLSFDLNGEDILKEPGEINVNNRPTVEMKSPPEDP